MKQKKKSPQPPTVTVDTSVRRFIVQHSNTKKPGKDVILYTLNGTVPQASVHGFPEVGRRLEKDGFTKEIHGVGDGKSLAVVCTAITVRNNGSSDAVSSRATVVTAHVRACPLPQAVLSGRSLALGIDDDSWNQILQQFVDDTFVERKRRQSMLVEHGIEYHVVNAAETYGDTDDYYVNAVREDHDHDDEDYNEEHPSWTVPPTENWTRYGCMLHLVMLRGAIVVPVLNVFSFALITFFFFKKSPSLSYDGGVLDVAGPVVIYARTMPNADAGPWWVASRTLRQPVIHCAVPTMEREGGLISIDVAIHNIHNETGRMKVLPSIAGVLEYAWGSALVADTDQVWIQMAKGVTATTVEMPAGIVSNIKTLAARFTVPGM